MGLSRPGSISDQAKNQQAKIFSSLRGGILHTVAGCQPYRWLQFGLWTKMALSLKHSANTSPPM